MNENRKTIVIVGGGTAGWMTATLMATHWRRPDFDITLVESPQIGIIGVGEGSTPPFKDFMEHIGARELEWMPACNATYKVGIAFDDWSIRPGFSSYFHPFLAQPDQFTVEAFYHNNLLRRNGIDLEAHPDHFTLATYLARHKLSPIASENFPFKIEYAYHFDAHLLGKFLAKNAMEKGVRHREATISHVDVDDTGNIAGLNTDEGEVIKADVYVDCTGFRGRLLQQALKVPFIPFADSLFNDAAVVFPTPQSEEIECRTVSRAMQYGWAWAIPLTNRVGNGYVYSSAFCGADQVETEFREHLGLLDDPVTARHLKLKVGRVQQHWAGNCLAVGLSQGFIEPLEATALDLTGQTILAFMEAWAKGNFTTQNQDAFNGHINGRFDAVRDYIACHYKVNTRTDTAYWIENRENDNLSKGLKAVLSSWTSGAYIGEELKKYQLDLYFAHFSWNCLLAGYGVFPPQESLRRGKEVAYKYKLDDISDFIRRCAMNFKPHRMQLESLVSIKA